MPEILTYDQIKEKCDSEWVLLGDLDLAETLEVKSGRLIFHSRDRDEVHKRARQIKGARIAILYMGTIPENTAILL